MRPKHMSTVIAADVQQTAATAQLTEGTIVLTLAGALPVEHLTPGDRIITRNGARSLTGLSVTEATAAPMIRVTASAIGVEQPEDDMFVTPGQQILIRDWRAKALKGAEQAVVSADKLADGEYIRAVTLAKVRLYTISFDAPQVIYANGLELACTAA